ncbi:MAG TPA: hypothetical protein ENK81_00495, partial [Euryarchaeota archaeon]|nr:hypothetical protein [Euryarchaeota archaeon]
MKGYYEISFTRILIRKYRNDYIKLIYPPFEAIISLEDLLKFIRENVGATDLEVEHNRIIIIGARDNP